MQKILYEQHIKILSKGSINRDGVWVEEVKILFILITKVWDISPLSSLPPKFCARSKCLYPLTLVLACWIMQYGIVFS